MAGLSVWRKNKVAGLKLECLSKGKWQEMKQKMGLRTWWDRPSSTLSDEMWHGIWFDLCTVLWEKAIGGRKVMKCNLHLNRITPACEGDSKGAMEWKGGLGVLLRSRREPILACTGVGVVEMMRGGQLENNLEGSQQDFLICEEGKEKRSLT